ncbi:hypothetical protein [Flectobacillus roseus]|uniref:hypothetical protein n=1 Tax=Flectobacillus roseus TaxID=502259 RepID=UPI0024B63E5D|nr:hypothetical protein [Flectobacillus roseus]MDI9871778.1 hypothetical protein [Flectobacillus roseus]
MRITKAILGSFGQHFIHWFKSVTWTYFFIKFSNLNTQNHNLLKHFIPPAKFKTSEKNKSKSEDLN